MRFFRRKAPNIPVLVDLPNGGHAYVWPQDLRLLNVTVKAGSRFYTQGDNHGPVKQATFRITRSKRWWQQ